MRPGPLAEVALVPLVRLALTALALMLVVPAARAATLPAATARAIAVAEDQRRFEPVLAGHLSHADASVRARAARAVGRLQDSTTVAAMTPLVRDPDVGVRREAVFALGQIGHRSARAALEGALLDRDADTRGLAVEALGKLLDPAATGRVSAFLRAQSPAHRRHAAVALWRLADTTAVDALIARLGDADASVRWRVVYALEKLVMPARIVPAVTPLLADADPLVRAHAARTLGRQRSRLASDALHGALRDSDAPTVVNAIRALQQVADSSQTGTATALMRLLTSHADPHVRVTAATALADGFVWAGAPMEAAAAAEASLHTGMQDRDAATRGACARALLVRRGFAMWRPVSLAAEDSVVYVRTAVLDGLRAMPEADQRTLAPQVVTELERAMTPARPLLERMTAIDVLGALAGRHRGTAYGQRVPALRALLTDRDMLIVASAAGALAEAGDSASVPALLAAYAERAADADADARLSIRDALRSLAGRARTDSLEQAHPAPAASAEPAAGFETPPTTRRARLHTSAGIIEWEFLAADAPQTVRNFVTLARRGYFDGLRVHRVVPDFVIQDGDPTGTGSGGPGWSIRCEYNRQRYESGMVGMALSGKDTGGSQWFITLAPQPHLDGRYTIFARVTAGLDVARRIVQGDRIARVELID